MTGTDLKSTGTDLKSTGTDLKSTETDFKWSYMDWNEQKQTRKILERARNEVAYFIFLYISVTNNWKRLKLLKIMPYVLWSTRNLNYLILKSKVLISNFNNCWNIRFFCVCKTCAIMLLKLFLLLICKNYKKRLNYSKTFFSCHL